MPKINFKKPRIKKNIESNLKSHFLFYFYKKDLGCPELGENKAPLKTHLHLLF